MTQKFTEKTQEITAQIMKLRKEIPEVMTSFSALAQAAGKDGTLNKKTKELIAIALAVSNRCSGCIGFHAQTLVKLHTTRQEFLETLAMAIYMGGGPSLMYAAEALEAFEEFQVS